MCRHRTAATASCREFDRTSDRYELAGTAPHGAITAPGWLDRYPQSNCQPELEQPKRHPPSSCRPTGDQQRHITSTSSARRGTMIDGAMIDSARSPKEELWPSITDGYKRRTPHYGRASPSVQASPGPLGSQRSICKGLMLREVTTGCCKFAMRRLSTDPVEGSTELLRFRQDV